MGTELLLTINSGSSSCKAALFQVQTEPSAAMELIADIEIDEDVNSSPLQAVEDWLQAQTSDGTLVAIGHRFVHGGTWYASPKLITSELLDDLEHLELFDPLHAKPANRLMREFLQRFPDVPQVVCFDTAFFVDMPDVAKLIALPRTFRDAGVRRYGFHGLSYTYVQREFERLAGTQAKNGRVVYAHLGSGSSLIATKQGSVIDTTMGFSPVSGIPSSTRSGDLDPTIARFLSETHGTSPSELARITQTESGLLAVSGTSGDMKHLLDIEPDDEHAAQAVQLYVYHVQKTIGALAATVGGIDSLVFTGGIGEQSSIIRSRICAGLSFLGIELNHGKNDRHEFTISADGSGTGVHVIPTNEALVIAEQSLQLTKGATQ